MNEKHERMLTAYMDGELSATEATEFDRALTDAERERLAGEVRLESAISDVLSRDAGCPDDVWARVREQLAAAGASPAGEAEDGSPARSRARLRWGMGIAVAAAAALLLVATPLLREPAGPGAGDGFLTARTVEDLRLESRCAAELAEVQRLITEQGFAVAIEPLSPDDPVRGVHGELLGARTTHYGGGEAVEVLFSCCELPAKVIIAREESPAAEALARAMARGEGKVVSARRFDGYMAAVVSEAQLAPDLLKLFRRA
jgi:hypothetical protein